MRLSLTLACLLGATAIGHAAPAVTIVDLGPGRFAVENPGAAPVSLQVGADLEVQTKDGWASIGARLDAGAGYRLVERCEPEVALARRCVDVPAGGAVVPVAWSGMNCSAQCNATCRANTYEAPGTYRLVVRTCAGATIAGPPFDLRGPDATAWERLGLTTSVTAVTAVRADPEPGHREPLAPAAADHLAGLVVRPGTEVTLDEHARAALIALMRDPRSVNTELQKRRVGSVFVGFRITRAIPGTTRSEVVELALALEGDEITAVYGGGANGPRASSGGYANHARAAWRALAKQLFPRDAEVTAVR